MPRLDHPFLETSDDSVVVLLFKIQQGGLFRSKTTANCHLRVILPS